MLSLRATGTPASGPTVSPAAMRASIARRVFERVVGASRGCTRGVRPRERRSPRGALRRRDTAERSPAWTARAMSTAVEGLTAPLRGSGERGSARPRPPVPVRAPRRGRARAQRRPPATRWQPERVRHRLDARDVERLDFVGVFEDVGELLGEHVELGLGHFEASEMGDVRHLVAGQSLRHRAANRRCPPTFPCFGQPVTETRKKSGVSGGRCRWWRVLPTSPRAPVSSRGRDGCS